MAPGRARAKRSETGAGVDTIRASSACGDTLRGGDGDDLLDDAGILGAGTVLDGGSGNDTLDVSSETVFGASISSIETLRISFRATLGPNKLLAFARLDLTTSAIALGRGRRHLRFFGQAVRQRQRDLLPVRLLSSFDG